MRAGPTFHPERLWYPNALMVGEDRVALDTHRREMLERKRAEMGMPTFEAAGRPPRYIATAADATHKLGTNDPQRIHRVESLNGSRMTGRGSDNEHEAGTSTSAPHGDAA